MATNIKIFKNGDRLPETDLNEFINKYLVAQVDSQADLPALEEYGIKIAFAMDTEQLFIHSVTGGWVASEQGNYLTLELADERYLTQLTAQGLFLKLEDSADFLTGDEISTTYLAKLTAQGLYLTQTDASNNLLGKSEAANTYLSSLTAQGLYLTQTSASNNLLGKTEASNTYITSLTAQGLYLTQTSASGTYLTSSSASGTYQAKPSSGSFITNITAGNLYIAQGNAAGDINDNATTISGGKITTNSINVNRIQTGTLTAFRIQTSSSGKRILLSESSNSLIIYDDSGSIIGRIQAGVAGGVLDITGAGTAGMSIGSASTVFDGNVSTSGTGNIVAAGRLGQTTFASLGTTTPVGRLGSTGLFGPTGSDRRIKKNIVDVDNGLELVNQLRPVKFQFISEEEGPVSYGLIAQEVQPLFDENENVVNKMTPDESGNEYLSVNYDAFIAPLIKAVQELSAKNDALEARLAAVEGI